MNESIIAGNMVSLIASICSLVSTSRKSYKETMRWQTIDTALFALSNLILGGTSGLVTNSIASIRAFCCSKYEMNKALKIGFILLTAVLGIIFRDTAWYGVLPLIASISYAIVVLSTDNVIALKIILIINNIMWGTYAIMIISVVSMVFNTISLILCTLSLISIMSGRHTDKAVENKI